MEHPKNQGSRRRARAALCAALMIAAIQIPMLSGCAKASDTGSVKASVAYDGRLAVGFDCDFPPFSYVGSGGEYTGFDVELAKAICERENLSFAPVFMRWDAKDTLLKGKAIDCVFGCSMMTREDKYAWSIPYIDNRIVIMTAEDSDITSASGLAGKRVYVQSSTGQAERLLTTDADFERTFYGLYEVDECVTAVDRLYLDDADACIMDVATAQYYAETYSGQMRILDEPLYDDVYGVALRLDDTELADKISETMRAMKDDGTLDALAEKWGIKDLLCVED